MSGLLGRLGGWCAGHGRAVLALWVIVAVGLMGGSLALGSPVSNDVSIPGSDAQRAHDLMRDGFGPGFDAGGTVQILLYSADKPLTSPLRRGAIDESVANIRRLPYVEEAEAGPSASTEIGVITVRLSGAKASEVSGEIVAAAAPARELGIEIVPAGSSSPADKEIKTGPSEIVGVLCALLVLVLAFGTLVAALVPILSALVSVAAGLGLIGLLGHVADVPKQAGIMATMIGLGVGIDYALFLTSRYRKLLADGLPVHEAVRRTTASSGGAVVFAGGTVIIALSALMLGGFPLLQTLGWITGLSVVFAVLTSVTFVPALLGVLGPRINSLRVLGRRAAAGGSEGPGGGWSRLAFWVARRPWQVLLGSVLALGLLSAPALALKLGPLDNGYSDQGTPARRAYELMQTGFGPGANGPLIVVAEGTGNVAKVRAAVEDVPGIARVTPGKANTERDAVLLQAIPDYAPSDPRVQDVVRDVRALALPGVDVHVGGEAAALADAGTRISERTPLVIGVVVLLSALLLLFAFRAPVVAFKAALMNLVSLGAAFGALALVFSFGLGSRLVGLDPPHSGSMLVEYFFAVPIDSYVPLMLFAVLFGLSMDYEVFLLTAVRQAYLRHGDNRRAVAEGLGSTGRVITSAALIMVAVFVAFIAYPDPLVKVFGVGLAVAIAVDATIIRGFLVPATMVLLGRANWWCPRWLDRLLPNLSVEGHEEDDAPAPPRVLEEAGAGRR
ncbi:MMPL family transporter [Nonomuraea sp. NPDC050328]|uniref:MMPL family transporter n=1 Tax=Nonomuraea sp. NPDC050328 TaxID=3364361 RepID=UPI003787C6E2